MSPPSLSYATDIIAWLARLHEETGIRPLSAILAELAAAFRVDGAGLEAVPPAPESIPFTIEEAWTSAKLKAIPRFAESDKPMASTDAAGHGWLTVALPGWNHRLHLWLATRAPRPWIAQEIGLFSLTARCIADRLEETPWRERALLQDRLDMAALVTRRLAHDFGNILTSVQGFAELTVLDLRQESAAARHARQALELSRGGVYWCRKLQLIGQQGAMPFVPANLPALIAEESRQPYWTKELRLTIDPAANLPPVAIAEEALRQVLSAVLENAREALSEVSLGEVKLSAREVELSPRACLELWGVPRPGRHVEVSIVNPGAELPPEAKKQLFRTFFFTTKGRQRGFGLALVYGLLKNFGGGLQLESATGSGAAVKIFLPVALGAG